MNKEWTNSEATERRNMLRRVVGNLTVSIILLLDSGKDGDLIIAAELSKTRDIISNELEKTI